MGAGSFDEQYDATRFRGFIAAGSGASVGFLLSWMSMQAESGLGDFEGPLSSGAETAGHGPYKTQLQRAVTRHREKARHADLAAIARTLSPLDLRVRAFNNVDSFAATPFTSCPTTSTMIPRHMYDWVVSTYLGIEVASLTKTDPCSPPESPPPP